MPGGEITVTLRGPIFSGAASQAAADCTRDIGDRVVDYALQAVQQNLDGSIRHPTPYYETQINIRGRSTDTRVVNDRGVIYGPWLEGTGSRNATTRFKGYASFRKAHQRTVAAVPGLSGVVIKRYLNRMG